jgi:ABC-type transporter Mla MlaB component
MVTIKKTGEGYYLASLDGKLEVIDRNAGYLIRKELIKLMKPHREISLDLKGVSRIETGGFKILQDLKSLMDTRKCRLRFINVEASLVSKGTDLNKIKKQPDTAESL